MMQGGIIIIDDYGWKNYPGAKMAISKFIKKRNVYIIVTTIFQCILIKK